jgi:uncharacterized protein (DUF433 family)
LTSSKSKPIIKGTRVPVGGMEIEEVAGEYGVKREDILAAIEYAAKMVAKEEIRVHA